MRLLGSGMDVHRCRLPKLCPRRTHLQPRSSNIVALTSQVNAPSASGYIFCAPSVTATTKPVADKSKIGGMEDKG